MWVSGADGGLGCAVVVVGGAERSVGGTLCWRHLILLAEMEEWVSWAGTVGAICVVQWIGDIALVVMVVEVGSWRWMCCGELLGLGGSVQVRGCWVPRWMTRMGAEAEGGLLMDCWWLLLEGGWP